MTTPIGAILGPLQDLMEQLILFLHDDVGLAWGLSIVGLTFIVRLAVLPLSIRGIKSMRRLQVLGPQMQELKEKYKDDSQRMQREMMEMYKREGINPFSSCLPFVLQIPFFIAIYGLLRGTAFKEDVEAAGGVSFLGIESILENPTGAEAVILAVLFVGTTIPTFLLTMSNNPTATGAQRYMFMFLPVVFAFFVPRLPAGLSVYWVATNIWSLGQQFVVQRLIPASPPPTPEEVKAAKPPPPPPRKRKRRR